MEVEEVEDGRHKKRHRIQSLRRLRYDSCQSAETTLGSEFETCTRFLLTCETFTGVVLWYGRFDVV